MVAISTSPFDRLGEICFQVMDCGPVASIFVVEIHNRQQFKLIDRYIVYDSSKSPRYSHSFSRILKTTSTTVAYGGRRAPIWENGNVEYVQQRNKKIMIKGIKSEQMIHLT